MERKIVFITKSLCYHQIGIADKLYATFGDSFSFIQMREPLDFRVKNGQEGFERPYLLGYQKDAESNALSKKTLEEADIIIWGEASLKVLKNIKKDCIILKYSERIFKNGYYKANLFHYLLNCVNLIRLRLFLRKKSSYLLSTGYYSSLDYGKFGLFKGRSLRWGYFPLMDNFSKSEHNSKEALTIVWVNRLLKWKHPEYALLAAETLKKNGVKFELNIVGDGDNRSGEMKQYLIKKIKKLNLSDCVHMLGKIQPQSVLELYKKTDIALFTSGPAEGWGVGLNEAMNYGCIVLASDKMGSTKYLINKGVNGFTYKFGSKESFVNTLLSIVNNIDNFSVVSKNATDTIQKTWCCDEASRRLAVIIKQLADNKTISPFNDGGPCSLVEE